MKKIILLFEFCILTFALSAQSISAKLTSAFKQFENDPQLKYAISSLYIIDAKTGKVVFDKNSQVGLAGASTQKIITASTAFELLGKDYRYKTEFWRTNYASNSSRPVIVIKPSGDPTFGSWRYATSISSYIFQRLSKIFEDSMWLPVLYTYNLYKKGFDVQKIPDCWIWQDIGNYYGAGPGGFNWKENQFDIQLSAGERIGDPVKILAVDSSVGILRIDNQLKTGPANSGDNAYYYFFYGNNSESPAILKGTIPLREKNFKISAAVADPYTSFINDILKNKLSALNHEYARSEFYKEPVDLPGIKNDQLIYTYYSPTLDSIIYWFLKKSINLYGEALVKTFAYEKQGFGSTDSGVVIVKNFWKEKGLDENELHIVDGSGLSPLNRITTHAQVEILKYAKTKDWFPYFYDALPEYNNMKMKSGTISGVKGFAGYQTSKKGNEYIFSFLVNNYNGSPSALVDKMYKVLDVLK